MMTMAGTYHCECDYELELGNIDKQLESFYV